MNPEFEKCLKKRKLREFSRGKYLVEKEYNIGLKDLEDAKDSFKREKFKWATIQAYYAMFHCARALIYAKNYREKSHYCLIVALRTLYVEKGELELSLVENFQRAKNLRENADYYDEWSEAGAEELLRTAEKFSTRVKEILKVEKT